MVPQACRRLAQGDHFGVRRWIFVHQIAVETASDRLSIFDDYSANGHFASLECELSLLERKLHPAGIIW
jgi:hypothetical protein